VLLLLGPRQAARLVDVRVVRPAVERVDAQLAAGRDRTTIETRAQATSNASVPTMAAAQLLEIALCAKSTRLTRPAIPPSTRCTPPICARAGLGAHQQRDAAPPGVEPWRLRGHDLLEARIGARRREAHIDEQREPLAPVERERRAQDREVRPDPCGPVVCVSKDSTLADLAATPCGRWRTAPSASRSAASQKRSR